jgi:hypothetical protein
MNRQFHKMQRLCLVEELSVSQEELSCMEMVLASQQVRGVSVCQKFVETARHILESFLVGGVNYQNYMADWNEASVDGGH